MHDSLYEEMYRMEQNHWWFTGRRSVVGALADKYLAAAKQDKLRVCELGCGTGGNLAEWKDEHDVLGIEPSDEARSFARKRLDGRVESGTLPNGVNAAPASWDLVLMTDVLEHVEDDFSSAETALSLLSPGGILIATVPAYPWLYSPRDKHHHHFRRYSKARFRQLFQHEGYQSEVLSHYNSFLFPPAAAVRLASKWLGSSSEQGDLKVPWSPMNRFLHATFASERWLLPRVTLPFGLSLVAVIRRMSDQDEAAKRKAA